MPRCSPSVTDALQLPMDRSRPLRSTIAQWESPESGESTVIHNFSVVRWGAREEGDLSYSLRASTCDAHRQTTLCVYTHKVVMPLSFLLLFVDVWYSHTLTCVVAEFIGSRSFEIRTSEESSGTRCVRVFSRVVDRSASLRFSKRTHNSYHRWQIANRKTITCQRKPKALEFATNFRVGFSFIQRRGQPTNYFIYSSHLY